MTGLDPNCALGLASLVLDFDNVFPAQFERLCRVDADQHRVIPGDLNHRLRQFLEPSIVREASVEDGGIAPEHYFETASGLGRLWDCTALGRHAPRGRSRAGNETVMQRLAPPAVKVAGVLTLPIGLKQVVGDGFGISAEPDDEFILRLAAIQRRNQGLDKADGAIGGASVAPLLKVMGAVDMPVREV